MVTSFCILMMVVTQWAGFVIRAFLTESAIAEMGDLDGRTTADQTGLCRDPTLIGRVQQPSTPWLRAPSANRRT